MKGGLALIFASSPFYILMGTRFPFSTPIWKAGRKFILLRARTGAILCIDQHAADERIKLEELERQVRYLSSLPTPHPTSCYLKFCCGAFIESFKTYQVHFSCRSKTSIDREHLLSCMRVIYPLADRVNQKHVGEFTMRTLLAVQ